MTRLLFAATLLAGLFLLGERLRPALPRLVPSPAILVTPLLVSGRIV